MANGAGGHGLAEHALANGAGHANGLPNGVVPAQAAAVNPDNALYQVFLRLPAQEIARCRTVCRLWRDITGTEAFRRRHHDHRYRTPMPLAFFRPPGLARVYIDAIDFRDRVPRPVMRFPLHHEELRIHGSCSGILLLSSGDRLYACNPYTRRWALLPPIHVDNHIIGFYLADVYQDGGGFAFQVLYHNRREPNCEYGIFELGAEAPEPPAWSIGRPALVHDVHLDLVLANGIAPSYMIPPVYVHVPVFLFWLPQAAWGNSDILVFDTTAQSFSLIPPPTIQVDGEVSPVGLGGQLLEIADHLAMTVISQARVDVWVQCNITLAWSCRYRIHLPFTTVLFAVAQDRNGPVQCPHIFPAAANQTIHSRHTFQESLLLHPDILPMQDTDAVDGDPPFFQNQ
uniref:Uncharacterized protein n=1 Tax=Avena sativa TaxID=4498 RepID=A0ACD5WH35_AVESA